MWFRFFENRKLLILLSSLVLLIIVVGITGGYRTELTWPEKVFKSSLVYVQKVVNKPASVVARFIEDLERIGTLYEENALLRQQLQDYSRLKLQLEDLREKQRALEKLVDYREQLEEKYVVAQVVARSADRLNDVIIIDRGEKDGIQPNMAVITHEGLIGRVESVTESMADVQLLTSTRSSNMMRAPAIAAAVKERKAFGFIEGYDHEKKALVLTMVDAQVKLKKGDTVVTYDQSEIYPPNLVIGTIQEVGKGSYGLDQTAYVKPTASFDRLRYVMVVHDATKLNVQEHLRQTKSEKKGEGGE